MNEYSQLQVLIAKQIRPLAQQLGYLPRVQPEGRNNGKLIACKRALTNNTEFSLARTYEHFDVVCYGSTIILKVIKRTFSWPVAPGDALPTPDAGGWAGTFGCTFGMASMASIILWFVHAVNVQNPLKMRSRKTRQREICCTKKNKYTETYTAWCWCIRKEKTTSTLRLVLVCTSKSGMDIMSLWNYHRYSPTEWKNWTELWPPSQCWLCRRLSGHALRQNLSRGLFSIWSILPKTPVWCLMHADKKKANKRGNCFWKARYINTLSTSIYSNLDGMR